MAKIKSSGVKLLGAIFLLLPIISSAKTIHYELAVTQEPVNLSGNKTVDWALTVNGTIPAPTLEFTEGDDAEILVTNKLKSEEVSIHWHGILLPPEMDGVAYVNTPPIHPGQSYTFRFKIRQHGTFWYHSHTAVQEQKGVYGAIVIHPKIKKYSYDKEAVLVLSDWSDENADQIIKNLRKDGDYYLYKKNSIQSWWGSYKTQSLGNFLGNEWTRMGSMDLSDVGYDAFLINGKRDHQVLMAHPGEKIRLRIINAAASSYFYVSLGQLPMTVISADGVDIEPIQAQEILMGMAETYDVLFEVPDHKNYEFRATAQDLTGFASAWIGMGEKVPAETKQMPTPIMDHSAHQNHEPSTDHSAHQGHGMAKPNKAANLKNVPILNVDYLKALQKTNFPTEKPVYDLKLVLGGDMGRYVWHINGKAIFEDRTILINEGDVVRITFENETMMHHPMHLHGHFFRVLNSEKDFSPLKHTVDVPPHASRTIEFLANERGEWMLHCHNLYHMKTGMARVIKYSNYTPAPQIESHQKHDPHLHDHLYFTGNVKAVSNHAEAQFRMLKTWEEFDFKIGSRHLSEPNSLESDLLYKRWFSNYFNLMAGGTYKGEFVDNKTRTMVGVGYLLPFLVQVDAFLDHTGETRLDLEKKFQWTKTVFSEVDVSFRSQMKTEYGISLMYAKAWEWSIGLVWTEENLGAGLHYKF